jgi:hypothetical protein
METPFDIVKAQVELVNDAVMRGINLEREIQKNKKRQTFEQFLQEVHMKDYRGTDDDAPDAFDQWTTTLDVQEVMDFAEEWGAKNWKI